MKRILIINSVCGTGSTGRIAAKIAEEYEAKGWEVRFGYGREAYVPESCRKWAVRIGSPLSVRLHGVLTRLFDWHADRICSWWSTRKFLKWAEAWKPDLLWLHNLHGYYINYELLFKWIKKHPEMKVRWTLHDSWAYTGHCAYFVLSDCSFWKNQCHDCPSKKDYPSSMLLSNARCNYERKKRAFSGVESMTLICPSKWLANLTRQGFLGQYPIEIVPNEIDRSIFKPTKGDFRMRMRLQDKTIILGVASVWDKRKGLEDFVSLRGLLDSRFALVVVGLTPKQIVELPFGIIGISRTNSPKELAGIYTDADWFFNPTREDIFSMTNMEAAACGCRVVTYDTGGAPEAIEGYDKAWVLKGADKSPEGFVRLLQSVESK